MDKGELMDTKELLDNASEWFKQIWDFELFNSGDSVIKLNQIIIAIMLIIIGLIVSKLISKAFGRRIRNVENMGENTAFVLQKLIYYFLAIIIVLIALPMAGIPITVFTVIGGALAIGVGFGAQNLINNLISGFIIMLEKPIRIGDILEVEGAKGRVAEIGNRCVRVRRTDGVDVLVPNSFFLEQPVVNWTLFDADLLGQVAVGVAYGSPAETVRDLMLKAAQEHDDIHRSPEPRVIFEDFGDNALAFRALFWTHVETPYDLRRIESDLRFHIDALFKENNIVIAFPQTDVHLDSSRPLEIKMVGDKPAN